jgi:hypothetical protein
MSDFNFGGTDEESAEIKKLNVEVVSQLHPPSNLLSLEMLISCAHSSKTPTTLRIGRNSFAPPRPSKEA